MQPEFLSFASRRGLLLFWWSLPLPPSSSGQTKIASVYFGGYKSSPEPPTDKVFDKVAIAELGVESTFITTMDDRPLFSYDTRTWVKEIEEKTVVHPSRTGHGS
jgi:hypothetical protein